MDKISWRPIVVLTAICLCVAALLAFVNGITAPVIEENAAAAQQKALSTVMPEARGFDEIELPENMPSTVSKIFRDTDRTGWIFVLTTTSQYSSEPMGITLAMTNDGIIMDIAVTSYYESKDFGKTSYPGSYVGKDQSLEGIDTVSGVTYSSTAFKNAVKDAFLAFAALKEEE